jgi:hypothetical protein
MKVKALSVPRDMLRLEIKRNITDIFHFKRFNLKITALSKYLSLGKMYRIGKFACFSFFFLSLSSFSSSLVLGNSNSRAPQEMRVRVKTQPSDLLTFRFKMNV